MRQLISPKVFLASLLALPVSASAQATADKAAAPDAAAPAPAAPAAPGPNAPEPGAVPDAALPGHLAEETRTATFEVMAVDPAARTITMREGEEQPQTFTVDKEVRNLEQVKVGDRVKVGTHQSTSIKILPPGELGSDDDAAVARSQPGERPGGVATRARSITVKVSSVFPEAKEFMTRNAKGQLRTWKVKDAKELEGIKSGDRLQLTSVSTLAVSVTPAPPAEAAPAAATSDPAAPPPPAAAAPAEPAKAPEPAAEPAKQ